MSADRRSLFSNGRVAHDSLRGQVEAGRFTAGVLHRVSAPLAPIRPAPQGAALDRQILYGHPVRQLEPQEGFARDETSGYVGYIPEGALGEWAAPTHRIAARSSFLFKAPDFKTSDPLHLSCGSLLQIAEVEGKYARTHDGQYAIAAHLAPCDRPQPDMAATAETLLGTPYLWAGNSAFGIDCSGLVQLAAQAAKLPCQGDSDLQSQSFGQAVPLGTAPRRNDLLLWKGHVAIVSDDDEIIHANAHHMAVAREGLMEAIARIERQGDGRVTAHRRA